MPLRTLAATEETGVENGEHPHRDATGTHRKYLQQGRQRASFPSLPQTLQVGLVELQQTDVQRGSRPGFQLRALQSRLFLLSNNSTRARDLVEPERPWPAPQAPQALAPRRSSTCGGPQRLGTTRRPCYKPAPGYGSGLPGTRRHSQEVNIRFSAPTLDSL